MSILIIEVIPVNIVYSRTQTQETLIPIGLTMVHNFSKDTKWEVEKKLRTIFRLIDT